jgi:hypothetical protein
MSPTRRRFIALTIAAFLLAPQLGAEPGLYSPNAYRGETFARVLTWRDSSGALVNLTGYVSKLQIVDRVSGTVRDEFADGTGLTLGGAAGTITWQMTAAETLALPLGNLAYDLRLTSGTSVVTYLLYGYVNVHETRTR